LSAVPGLGTALLLTGGPRTLIRVLAADAAIAAQKPQTPHIYLFSIAVRPGRQGHGLGRQLMLPMLAACDRAHQSAYLESSNPANHGFYASLGFETVGEIRLGPGAPSLTPMWREPR
tara:strand:+ start:3212 stop:3562 length:351 start_codon:yes stop_codon:yes gene_type:complete